MTDKALRLPSEIFQAEDSEELFCVTLPKAGIDALLAMAGRLHWSIWRDVNEDRYQLTDNDAWLLDLTVANLLLARQCEEEPPVIITLPPEVITIIKVIKEQSEMCCCCGCNNNGSNEPPIWGQDPGAEPGLPSPSPEPQEEDPAEWCDRSTEIASRYVSVFTNLERWWDGINVTGDTILLFIETYFGELLGFALILIPAISAALTYLLTNSLTEQAKTIAENSLDDLICAVYNSTSPAGAKYAFGQVLIANYGTASLPVKTMMYLVSQIIDWDKVYDLESIPTGEAYIGSHCPCSETEPPDEEDTIVVDEPNNLWLVPVTNLLMHPDEEQVFQYLGGNTFRITATPPDLYTHLWRFDPVPAEVEGFDNEPNRQHGMVIIPTGTGANVEKYDLSTLLGSGTIMHSAGNLLDVGGYVFTYEPAVATAVIAILPEIDQNVPLVSNTIRRVYAQLAIKAIEANSNVYGEFKMWLILEKDEG